MAAQHRHAVSLTIVGAGTIVGALLSVPSESSTTQEREPGHSNREAIVAEPGDDSLERLAGGERTATSARISQAVAPDGAEAVVLASAEAFPDALTAASLAFQLDAPVLLSSSQGLSAPVREEITRLGADRAVLLGGTHALGSQVEDELEGLATEVERVAGSDRFATAARIAETLQVDSDTVFLASGTAWPDALSIAPVAARQGAPLLLAMRDGLPGATLEALDRLDASHAVIAGGSAVVGDAVEHELDQLGMTFDRVGGRERFQTSKRAVEVGMWSNADARRIWLATGHDWPDALAAAAAVAQDDGVLQLVDSAESAVGGPAADLLRGWGPEVEQVAFVGGGAVLPEAFEDQARSLLEARAPAAHFHVADLQLEGEDVRAEFAPHPEADAYEVRDSAGQVLHNGTEPVFSVDDGSGAVTVVATDEGEAVAQRDLRMTPFTGEGVDDLRLGASFDGEQVVLNWTASTGEGQARKVVRHRVEETDEGDRQLVDAHTVAYTCRDSAVDDAREASEEYAYELLHAPVDEEGFCAGEREPGELARAAALAGVRVPANRGGLDGASAAEEPARSRPLPTSLDRHLPSADSERHANTAQQDIPLLVRYQTFIADEFVSRPLVGGQFFEGDGRGFWPKGSYRTRFDVTTHFGDDARLETDRQVSPTRLYENRNGEMHFIGERTAGVEGMQFFENFQEPHRAMWTLQHDVAQPFPLFGPIGAPGIGYEITVLVEEGASHFRGEHDLAPHHEIWFAPVPGHFWQAYGRQSKAFSCLGPRPFCTGRINVRL